MALSDGSTSVEQIAQMEEILSKALDGKIRAEAEEEAACSEERFYAAKGGTEWTYVVVHNAYVRITGCKTAEQLLVIPDAIEGKLVLELAVDACSYLESVREIYCSDSIVKIGACAFRVCKNLERLRLPREVDTYDSSWVRGCTHLTELILPGKQKRVYPNIFDVGELKFLRLGACVETFVPGVFSKSKLERIDIDADNPHLSSDGKAIFAHEGRHIRVLAVPCEHYTVPQGCRTVEIKAFANHAELRSVDLPDSVTIIEDHAFSYSGLEKFDAPAELKNIGARAFFRCRNLTDVVLNDGLSSIDDDAFTGSGVTRLVAPATLESLGRNVAADTQLTFSGENASFTIAPNGIMELDHEGGLYRNTERGKHFVRILDGDITEYRFQDGTVEIEAQSFAHHSHIKAVYFPEGLRVIGDAAFRDCHDLAIADFPSTLEEVGKEAFLDTSLERVRIPRKLARIGDIALVTHGAHNGDVAPSLKSIEVEEGNEHFYSAPGILCERRDKGGAHVVVYADSVESVRIPADVTAIDPYAFGGARHLRELYLSTRIHRVGMRGLSLDCLVEHFHIDLEDPIDGHESFDMYFPDSGRSAHEIQLAFNLSSSIDPMMMFKHYDSAIVNMHEFDKREKNKEFDVYGQAKLALSRLSDPVLMTDANKVMLTQVITDNLTSICEACARHDDREAIDTLLDLGLLNKDNLLDVIESVGKLQDAAMTGYLLEVKRRFFSQSAIDFDL